MPEPQRHLLPSGLTTVLEEDPAAQSVAAGLFVNTGARDELAAQMGASHFLEHLLFKGSEAVSAPELNRRLDALGGPVNAFTSEEHTVYHAAALPESQGELLESLSLMLEPALRPSDIEAERGVILEEIEMYADQPAARLLDALRGQYWGAHPLGHLVLGTRQTVSALDRTALRRNFTERYGTPQITLVACGQLDAPALLKQAQRLSVRWPRQPFTRALRAHAPRPALTVHHDPALTRQQLMLCAPGLSAADPLWEAAQVLAEIIGGDNGRLYWALLDSGLCESADFAHLEFAEVGTFEGGFTCDPERAQEALGAFVKVLRDVQRGVSPQEVRRAARKLAVSSVLRAETPQGRLFGLGMEYLARTEVLSAAQDAQRYEAVSVRDVGAVLARTPFALLSIAALGSCEELTWPQG